LGQVEDYFNWLAATGFNGLRVFAGALPWAPQSPEQARANLPAILDLAEQLGLYVEVTALTDTKTGYDKRAHVHEIAAIMNDFSNGILEFANEPWHPTQDDQTHEEEYLLSLRGEVPGGIIWAVGASQDDESEEMTSGLYGTKHLSRSRDEWNMVRRVRELEAVSGRIGKFVMNNEPVKFGTGNQNPSIAFTMSVLCRIFEVGGVYHSDPGLQCLVPTGHDLTLAEAYVRGARLIQTQDRMVFKNATWPDSPIRSANFDNVVRVYSGLSPSESVAVALGITGNPEIVTQNGYHLGVIRDQMDGVQVIELVR
jgi:hypothetical protein